VIKRAFIGIAWAVGGIIALVLISLGVLAWRMTAGPVSLGVLTPVMEMALNTVSGPLSVSADDTIVKWNRSDGILDVRLVNARASSSGDEVVVRVPELFVGLNADALLRGAIVPTEIEIVRPDVRIVRPADATPDPGDTEEALGAPLSTLMSALAEIPGPDSQIRGLESVRVVDGTVDVEDGKTGIAWRGTLQNTRVWRGPSGINAESSLSATSAGQQSDLAFTG
jgi:hypothetical protein